MDKLDRSLNRFAVRLKNVGKRAKRHADSRWNRGMSSQHLAGEAAGVQWVVKIMVREFGAKV